MEKVVFFDTARRKSLETFLPIAAQRVTAAGDAMRASFPALPWNTRALWVLAFESGARDYLCKIILQRAADAAGLLCAWDKEAASTDEETRLNRKIIEMQTREARAPFLALDAVPHLEAYLRTGVLSIGKKGETITAQDAAARLDAFCTLNAETDAQAAFVAALERLQRAALELESAYKETLKAVPAGSPPRRAFAGMAWQYTAAEFGLSPNAEGFFPLTAQDAPARALIGFFNLAAKWKEPKFYNLAGIWAYTPEDAAALFGCKLGALQMRSRYPHLYSGTKNPKAWQFWPDFKNATL